MADSLPPGTWEAATDILEFEEAVRWFLSKSVVTKEDWELLTVAAQRKAFTVAGVAQADVLEDVYKAIDRAVSKGESLGTFKKAVGEKLLNEWKGTVANPAWRIETIYRTGVQSAYSAGRYEQMTHPAVAKMRPYWIFDAILDNRVSFWCEPLAGTVLPADDPWWQSRIPPLHFCCRSSIRTLRVSQAEKRVGFGKDPPDVAPQEGFGMAPDKGEWEPDLSKYSPGLRQYVAERLSSAPEFKPLAMPATE